MGMFSPKGSPDFPGNLKCSEAYAGGMGGRDLVRERQFWGLYTMLPPC